MWMPDGNPRRARRTNDHTDAHLWANTFPYELRICESVQQLWNYSICKNFGTQQEFTQGSDGPMTNLYIFRGQDGSIELEMVRISPTVVELWHLENLGTWRARQEFSQGPAGQWQWRCTSMGQDGSIDLDMVWIEAAVVKLQHPQKIGCPRGEWVIKFHGLSRTAGVHVAHINRIIIACTLESLSHIDNTQSTGHN